MTPAVSLKESLKLLQVKYLKKLEVFVKTS